MLLSGVTPVTTPEVFTDAIEVFALLHTPPDVVLVSAVVLPAQTVGVPPMAAGKGVVITLITIVCAVEPQLLVTV